MSIKIYQAYYQEDQLPNLDPEFTPFDNTVNPVNNLYELYIYKQVRELAEKAGDEMWGVFSWQWKNKLQGPTAKQILDHVQKSKDAGADVVIFNAYPWDEPEAYNVWEQGEWCHPGIAMLGARILDTMGEDYNLVMQPMDYTTYLAANYFVGNKVFWDGLLAFLDKFVAALDELDDEDKELLHSSAGYGPNPKLDYTGFICERLISTYLVKEEANLAISAWRDQVIPFSDTKHDAVQSMDKEKMLQWNINRRAKGAKIAQEWINQVF
jgi:hypothetical protein